MIYSINVAVYRCMLKRVKKTPMILLMPRNICKLALNGVKYSALFKPCNVYGLIMLNNN